MVGERDPIVVSSDVFGIPDSHRHADMARAVVIEYLAGDLTVDELDRELDWYLRGIQPRRP